MKYHIIHEIIPVQGELREIHESMLGKRCYPIITEVGFPGYIKVDVGDTMDAELGCFHTITTTRIESMDGSWDDPEFSITTKNTKYVFKAES